MPALQTFVPHTALVHVMVPPQLSENEPAHLVEPHTWLTVSGVQHALALHTCPLTHGALHATDPPQPLDAVPPHCPAAHCDAGEQHELALQTCPDEQSLIVHVTEPPQPSLAVPPHCVPHACATLLGAQHAAW